MANTRAPEQKFVSVSDVNTTLTFLTLMSTAFILNSGSNPVWFKFDGVPVAADANGRTQLPAGVAFNLPAGSFTSIGFICAAGLTSGIQVIATQAPQDGSFS